ncbi:hypothetical protein D1872_178440 [compost metagenome]
MVNKELLLQLKEELEAAEMGITIEEMKMWRDGFMDTYVKNKVEPIEGHYVKVKYKAS